MVVKMFVFEMLVLRLMVNIFLLVGVVGGMIGFKFFFILGCGLFGGNIMLDNVIVCYLLNIKWMVYGIKEVIILKLFLFFIFVLLDIKDY